MIQQVSDFELELMKTIWGNGGAALYAEIVEALEAKGMPATQNTIIPLLSRLIKNGYLSSKKAGCQNTYTALVSETELITADDYDKLKKHWEGGSVKND